MDLRALLVDKREDRFSQTFAALLRMSGLRTAFLQRATGWQAVSDEGWRVANQVPMLGGIADLLLESANRTVVVESKLDAPFTDGQPTAYAAFLDVRRREAGAEVHLVLLVPSARSGPYLQQASERLQAAEVQVPISVVTWEDTARLAKTMYEREGTTTEERVFLGAYVDLIEAYVGGLPRPLTDAETLCLAGPESRVALQEARRLVPLILHEIARRLTPSIAERAWSSGDFYSGKGFDWLGRGYWLGCWLDPWFAYGVSPLWIQMYGRKPILDAPLFAELEVREYGTGLICPLPLRANLDPHEQVRVAADRCETFIRSEEPRDVKTLPTVTLEP
jgi:hypothetical protein